MFIVSINGKNIHKRVSWRNIVDQIPSQQVQALKSCFIILQSSSDSIKSILIIFNRSLTEKGVALLSLLAWQKKLKTYSFFKKLRMVDEPDSSAVTQGFMLLL